MNFLKLYLIRRQLKKLGRWRNYPLNSIKLKSRLRLLAIKEKQGRVSLSAGLSLTITVLFGLLSLIIPVYLNYDLSLLSLCAVIAVLLMVPVVAAHVSLRGQPNDIFAKLALTNQSPTHSIVFTSKEIRLACINVAYCALGLHVFFKEQAEFLKKDILAKCTPNYFPETTALEDARSKAKKKLLKKTRKQKAYPGADLNYLCWNIIRSIQDDDSEKLKALRNFLKDGLKKPKDSLIKGLFDLEVLVNTYIKKTNSDLIKNFNQHIEKVLKEHCAGKEVFFLTQGYSRTVKVCIEKIMKEKWGRVFILRPVNSPYGIKSQMLYNELKESYRQYKNEKGPQKSTPSGITDSDAINDVSMNGRIALCDQYLMPEILPKNAIVIILSGAEIFDDGLRVVNCQQEEIKRLIEKFSRYQIEFKCISLTCEYKKSDKPLYDNTSFTKDHLEGMDSLSKHVSWIVTDRDVYSHE